MNGRWTTLRTVCLWLYAGLAAAAVAGAQDMADRLPEKFTITRAASPFRDFTGTAQAEKDSLSVAAAAFTKKLEAVRGLEAYRLDREPWLALDRAVPRIVVNDKFFSPLARPDATRIREGERLVIGRVKDKRLLAAPARLFAFLLESQIVITYWHIEAVLETVRFEDAAERAEAVFQAEHVYFTNEKNTEAYSFSLRLDKKTGELSVSGGR